LNGFGLNPKLPFDMACVTIEEVKEVWGKCSAFETTNTTLNLETRNELLQLYAKIYGKMEVTNNEFMTWVVKGYIAEVMGFEVDWAIVAASTALVIASRVEGELMRRDLSTDEAAKLLRLAPHVVLKQSPSQSKSASPMSTGPSEWKGTCSRFKAVPVGGVPRMITTEVADAKEVLRLEEELLANTENKLMNHEPSKKLIEDKIIGFKFGMDDREADVTEAAKNASNIQDSLKKLDLQIAELFNIVSLVVTNVCHV
jgi:hypothetical protein